MRRRWSAPRRRGPDGRKLPFLLFLLIVIGVAACGQATSTNEPGGPTEPGATDASAPSGTVASPPGDASGQPTTTTDPTSPAPGTEAPSAPAIEPSANPGSSAGCTGSDANRDFFASMAAAVDWTVYCPVLPDGWFVDDGQYRLAGGGWMRISYDGPGDAGILLQQGAFCAEADGCVPGGQDIGETAFGDRTGTLVSGGDGRWSIVVDRGAARSWLLTVSGLDESGARSIAEDMLAIAS